MKKNILNSTNVERIFMDCLFKEKEIINGEPTTEPVFVDGIVVKVGFNKQRLESYLNEISGMLSELPTEFNVGASFLSGCNNKDGIQWGEHRNMDQLFSLGLATGKVKNMFPKNLWSTLPGGMPYYIILKNKE